MQTMTAQRAAVPDRPDVLLHAQPTRQFVTTGQLGALALFLCSGAATSITGTALPVEGGWTAQ